MKGEVTGNSRVGGVCGYNYQGTILNCRYSGTVALKGFGSFAGGICGYCQDGTIQNCQNDGTVTGQESSARLGGICGQNNMNDSIGSTIKNCLNTGGVVGSNDAGGAVKNCRNTGVINGGGQSDTGGVAGGNYGAIENCCNTGKVTNSGDVSRTGGVVGYNKSGTMKNCYNTGVVTSDGSAGGVAGKNNSGTVTNCYYLAVAGLTGIGGTENADGTVEGKTEEEFASGTVARLLGDAYGQALDEAAFPQLIALDPDVPRVYQVTFDFNDGDVTPDRVSYTNGAVTPPAAPTRTGYTFTGWEDYTEGTPVTADAVFTAQWAAAPTGGGSSTPTYRPDVAQPEGGEVSISPSRPSRGQTVTITPDPDDGYEVDTVTVTDRNGNEVEVTDNGDGTFSFTQPSGKVTIEVTFRETEPAPLPFADVPADHWAHDAIRYVYEHGLMAGTGADTFEPDAQLTRAMVVTVLWAMEGGPVVNYLMDYEDVSEDAWYAEAVRWAASEGIAVGYGNGYFGPDDVILREQLATMLYACAVRSGLDVSVGEDTSILSYADALDVSDWAVPALQWACGAGVIGGKPGGVLDPAAPATRAEAAVMLMQFCELDK